MHDCKRTGGQSAIAEEGRGNCRSAPSSCRNHELGAVTHPLRFGQPCALPVARQAPIKLLVRLASQMRLLCFWLQVAGSCSSHSTSRPQAVANFTHQLDRTANLCPTARLQTVVTRLYSLHTRAANHCPRYVPASASLQPCWAKQCHKHGINIGSGLCFIDEGKIQGLSTFLRLVRLSDRAGFVVQAHSTQRAERDLFLLSLHREAGMHSSYSLISFGRKKSKI